MGAAQSVGMQRSQAFRDREPAAHSVFYPCDGQLNLRCNLEASPAELHSYHANVRCLWPEAEDSDSIHACRQSPLDCCSLAAHDSSRSNGSLVYQSVTYGMGGPSERRAVVVQDRGRHSEGSEYELAWK